MNDVLTQFVSSDQAILDSIRQLDSDNSSLAAANSSLSSQNSSLQSQLSSLQSQLSALQNITVFDHLEYGEWLLAGGTAANSGATGNTAVATQTQPGVQSASFSLSPNGSFANAYWFKRLGARPEKKSFKYELSILMPSPTDAAASQAVEFEWQQVISHKVFNIGWQFDFAQNVFRVWNRTLHGTGKEPWIATPLTSPRWTAGSWANVAVEGHRDDGGVFYDTVTINGVRTVLNISFPATLEPSQPDMLNVAFQLDGNGSSTSYRVNVDNIKFTAS